MHAYTNAESPTRVSMYTDPDYCFKIGSYKFNYKQIYVFNVKAIEQKCAYCKTLPETMKHITAQADTVFGFVEAVIANKEVFEARVCVNGYLQCIFGWIDKADIPVHLHERYLKSLFQISPFHHAGITAEENESRGGTICAFHIGFAGDVY